MADDVAMTAWLADFLARHGGTSGTVHLVDGDVLRLVAAINIPPPVRAVTTVIPRGKGMAGLTARGRAGGSSMARAIRKRSRRMRMAT